MQQHQYGLSNDSIAARRGRARLELAAIAPAGTELTAINVGSYRDLNGNTSFYYLILAAHDGQVRLLTLHLADLGYHHNRKRGAIAADSITNLIADLGSKVHHDPRAYQLRWISPPL